MSNWKIHTHFSGGRRDEAEENLNKGLSCLCNLINSGMVDGANPPVRCPIHKNQSLD